MPGRRMTHESQAHTGPIGKVIDTILGRRYDILERIAREFDSGDSCPEIAYLGDSTVLRIADEDRDRRSTAEMLATDLSGRARVLELSHGAYHMGIYYHMVSTFRVTRKRPRVVVIPVNMRSFSPQWYLRPSWEFQAEIGLLHRYCSGKGLRLRYRRTEASNGYEQTRVEYPMTSLQTIGEFEKLRLSKPDSPAQQEERRRELFVYFFLHPISEGHPLLVKLTETVGLARALGLKIVFYMTPINTTAALKSVGREFEQHFSRNLQVVKDALTAEKCFLTANGQSEGNDCCDNPIVCMDLSQSLGSDCFFHDGSIDEHLNERGRRFVSKRIGTIVLRFLQGVDSGRQQG